MSSETRRLAGRYVLEAPIGRGGMGEVWRGTDTVLGREVAIKTIDLRRLPDETGAARFEREARVTAGLNHAGIVTVHDHGVEGDTAYLVMELLPGPSLADRIADGPVPVDEVVEVGQQVAAALDAAHARGLVHRDIKPANIAYAGDGRVRVLDFGITQLGEAAGSQALTATHTVMGTAEYLAPEQALGGRVDGRADLYALGCVLYALLAGRPPFRGPTPVATMMMHGSDPVPDVRGLRPDTPDWLADLVHGLLAKNPADRPMGAATVAAALAARESTGGGATVVLPASGAAAAGAAAVNGRRCARPVARSATQPLDPAAVAATSSRPVGCPPARRPTTSRVGAHVGARRGRDRGDRPPRVAAAAGPRTPATRRRLRRRRRRWPRRHRGPRSPHRPPSRPPQRRLPRRVPRPPTRPSRSRTPSRRSPRASRTSSEGGRSARTPRRSSTTSSGTCARSCGTTTPRASRRRPRTSSRSYDKGVADGDIPADAEAELRPLTDDLVAAADEYARSLSTRRRWGRERPEPRWFGPVDVGGRHQSVRGGT